MIFNIKRFSSHKAIDAFIAVEFCLAVLSLIFYSKEKCLYAFITLAVFAINAIVANIFFICNMNKKYHEYIEKENGEILH